MIRKLLIAILAIGLCASPCIAMEGRVLGNVSGRMIGIINGDSMGRLPIDGTPFPLTYYKDFGKGQNGGSNMLISDYSLGSPILTFTGSRDATHPSTYINASGNMRLVTTSNVVRFPKGYYDSTGFHAKKGIRIESAATNMLQDSYFADGTSTYWRAATAGGTVTTSTARTSMYTVAAQVLKVDTDAANKGFMTAVANKPTLAAAAYTISCYIRGSGTVKIGTDEASGLSSSITLQDNYWQFEQYSYTSASGAKNVQVVQTGAGTASFYVTGIQIEAATHATSFIPTTTAALTRNAETLSGVNSKNRTVASETVIIEYAPGWAATAPVANYKLLDSDADRIVMGFVATSDSVAWYPNVTDSAGTNALAASDPTINTSYFMTGVSYGATAGTNAEIYVNGTTAGTSATNYTEPTLGTNFYIGSQNDGTLQINGIIQKIIIIGRGATASEISNASH